MEASVLKMGKTGLPASDSIVLIKVCLLRAAMAFGSVPLATPTAVLRGIVLSHVDYVCLTTPETI